MHQRYEYQRLGVQNINDKVTDKKCNYQKMQLSNKWHKQLFIFIWQWSTHISTGLESPVWLVAFVVTLFLGTWLKFTDAMSERRTNSEHPSLTNYPAGREISPTKTIIWVVQRLWRYEKCYIQNVQTFKIEVFSYQN